MSLTPDTRVLLTDSLHPPIGHRLDTAVGTTYSTNLTSLLMVPVSFAMSGGRFDAPGQDGNDPRDPIAVLEAVRRYSERTTVFCQAGGIHVPPRYPRLLPFVEDSLIEVNPDSGGIFHPKLWALRFVDEAGDYRHRLVVLSRNLTFDRSWDTALVLDEADDGAIDGRPAADFLRWVPSQALRDLPTARRNAIDDLAATLGNVSFAPPPPYTGGRLLPLRPDDEFDWPIETSAKRLLAISPFLDRTALRIAQPAQADLTLVSRLETLDQLGSAAVSDWASYVLQDWTEVDDTETPTDGFLESPVGLHAKTFIADLTYGRSVVVTGSGNLTSAAWGDGSRSGQNVEFDVVLEGPTWGCGVLATLDGPSPDANAGGGEAPGLRNVLNEYRPATAEGKADPTQDTAYVIEVFHRALAATLPRLHLSPADQGAVTATLHVELPLETIGESEVWPISKAEPRPLAERVTWELAETNVTPYVAIETTYGEEEARATRRCVITTQLIDTLDHDRRQQAMLDLLTSSDDVLRYLVYLLGDAQYGALLAQLAESGSSTGVFGPPVGDPSLALLDPLVRAVGQDADSLERIGDVMRDLRAQPDGEHLIPEGFDALWDIVWTVHQEPTP